MQRKVEVPLKMLDVWASFLRSSHMKKRLHHNCSESWCILKVCKLYNLAYVYVVALTDWINWLHRVFLELSCSCHGGTPVSRRGLPATMGRKALSELVVYSDSAVTQMTPAAHKQGDYLPSAHCLIPLWETILLLIYCAVLALSGKSCSGFRLLLTGDQWQKKSQTKKNSYP